jgi:gliding motility-associated-like protein
MDGTYTYTVTSEGYDTITGSLTVAGSDLPVQVQMELSSVTIEASEVLTPNGDGYNETWIVNNIQAVKDYKLYILNNIGEVIYESENYDNTWNGTYNDTPLDGGTYYYIFQKDSSVVNGFITIVR